MLAVRGAMGRRAIAEPSAIWRGCPQLDPSSLALSMSMAKEMVVVVMMMIISDIGSDGDNQIKRTPTNVFSLN